MPPWLGVLGNYQLPLKIPTLFWSKVWWRFRFCYQTWYNSMIWPSYGRSKLTKNALRNQHQYATLSVHSLDGLNLLERSTIVTACWCVVRDRLVVTAAVSMFCRSCNIKIPRGRRRLTMLLVGIRATLDKSSVSFVNTLLCVLPWWTMVILMAYICIVQLKEIMNFLMQ